MLYRLNAFPQLLGVLLKNKEVRESSLPFCEALLFSHRFRPRFA